MRALARSADGLYSAQQALRSRFEDFRFALGCNDVTALKIALADFDAHLRRWTEAEEQALVPALCRTQIFGRDPQRELRLEYVQVRELTRYLLREIDAGIRPGDLTGFVENLDRRLRAHESEMRKVYYPAAEGLLTDEEWAILEAARPEE